MNSKSRESAGFRSFSAAIRTAYQSGQEDEALEPIVRVSRDGRPVGRIAKGDSVIFYDVRGEREIELTRSLTDPGFWAVPPARDLDLSFVTMIEYDPGLRVRVAFPKQDKIRNTLAEVVAGAGMRLAKIAESEKAVHVGFFLNGKNETVFPGEERVIVPSPAGLANYDACPEMSASAVTGEVIRKMADPGCRLIVANFANIDVVGHTENRPAVLRAVESVDQELGKAVAEAERRGLTVVITSDHGTVEEWLYPDGTINTGHTKNPVPFILADFSGGRAPQVSLRNSGELADVAPTVLDILGLGKPSEMTGSGLLAGQRPERLPPGKRVVMLILDGWGLRREKPGNLIDEARTPNFDRLWEAFPHARLQSSGEAVGMPAETVGNSEAGHLHIGSGRRILLDRVRIDRAVADGSFFSNDAFLWAMEGAVRGHRALHLMGIISHYSSHGTIDHLFALLELARRFGARDVFIHGFIGRRGEKPESGAVYVEKVEETCRALGVGEVATVIGRFWALDREQNWDRVEKTYRAIVLGEGARVIRPE